MRGLADRRFARRPVLKPPRYSIAVCNPSLLTVFKTSPCERIAAWRHGERAADVAGVFGGRFVCLRQPELDGGPLTQLAPDLHGASGLSGKALDHRQAKAGPNPQFL